MNRPTKSLPEVPRTAPFHSDAAHPTRTIARIITPLTLLLAAIALFLHTRMYFPFLDDDALISLRYAARFLNGHGLTWTDGPRVEGYSNLLWILLVAAPGHFGIPLDSAARVIGFACMLGAIAAVSRSWLRPVCNASPHDRNSLESPRRIPITASLTGALVMVAAAPIAVWSIGGLEQPLVALLLAWGLVFADRAARPGANRASAWKASLCFALLCLTRPDSPLFVVATVAALLVSAPPTRHRPHCVTTIAALPIIAVAAQTLFRLEYYGQWLPNPAWVKLAPSSHHFQRGLEYLTGGFLTLLPISLAALVALAAGLFRRHDRRRPLLLAFNAIAWSIYLVAIGGDIFAAYRHWTPLIVIMAMALADTVARLEVRADTPGTDHHPASSPAAHQRPRYPRTTFAAIILTLIFSTFFWQRRSEQVHRALTQRTEWDGRAVGLMLKRGFLGSEPRIAVDAAGAVPYWSQLPAIDMLGLNDPHIPHHPPKDFGKGFLGHELGDGKYVLDQRPDLILFKDPRGRKDAVYLSGRQMQALPVFAREYSLVTFEVPAETPFNSLIWVRRASPTIGIIHWVSSRSGGFIIPAWQITSNPETTVHISADNRFFVRVARNQPASVSNVSLFPGSWTLRTDADGPLAASILSTTGTTIATGPLPLTFDMPKTIDSMVTIQLNTAGDNSSDVRGITLTSEPSLPARTGNDPPLDE